MARWHLAVFLGLACAPPKPAPGGPPAPAPGPTPPGESPAPTNEKGIQLRTDGVYRYALGRRDSLVAQMPSGESQVQVTGQTAYVTISLQPTPSGTQFSAVLDSVRPDPDITIPSTQLDSAEKARWTSKLQPSGWLDSLKASKRSFLADEVRDQVNLLFPIVPTEGVRAGATWEATGSVPARLSVVDLTETVAASGSAGQVTSADGVRFVPVTVVRSTSGQGSSMQSAQPLDLSATGRDSLDYRLSSDGRVLAAEGTSSRTMTLTVRDVGQTVPVTQDSRVTFQLLP
jgi:hypothetical protein